MRGPPTKATSAAPRASRTGAVSSIRNAFTSARRTPMLIESTLAPENAVLDETCPAGEPWTGLVKKGQIFRILDLEGNQAVDTLFYSADGPEERYSAVDTIRRQGNLYLGVGSVLYSSEGRPMLTIVADTCGRHDTLG